MFSCNNMVTPNRCYLKHIHTRISVYVSFVFSFDFYPNSWGLVLCSTLLIFLATLTVFSIPIFLDASSVSYSSWYTVFLNYFRPTLVIVRRFSLPRASGFGVLYEECPLDERSGGLSFNNPGSAPDKYELG